MEFNVLEALKAMMDNTDADEVSTSFEKGDLIFTGTLRKRSAENDGAENEE